MPDPIKTPADSAVETRYLVMPGHANAFGTAFGGAIMSWIDMVAAMAAQKHCGREVVTAGIDSVAFEQPVRIGEQVVLLACVNYVSKTSMEVGVKVIRENPATGERITATRAFLNCSHYGSTSSTMSVIVMSSSMITASTAGPTPTNTIR